MSQNIQNIQNNVYNEIEELDSNTKFNDILLGNRMKKYEADMNLKILP